VGGPTYLLSTLGRRHQLSPVFARVAIWWAVIGLVWLAGGLADGGTRVALVPVAAVSSALALMAAATAVLVALVLWDLRAERTAVSG
jgi:low temperature requirement protein LtrA